MIVLPRIRPKVRRSTAPKRATATPDIEARSRRPSDVRHARGAERRRASGPADPGIGGFVTIGGDVSLSIGRPLSGARQEGPQADLGLGLALGQAGSESGDLAQP